MSKSELKLQCLPLLEKAYQTEPKELKKVARDILLALPKEAVGACDSLNDYLVNSNDPRELFDVLPIVKRFIEDYTESKEIADESESEKKFDIKQSMREIAAARNAPVASLGIVDIIPTPEVNKRTDAAVIDFISGNVVDCGEAEIVETEAIGEFIDPEPNNAA